MMVSARWRAAAIFAAALVALVPTTAAQDPGPDGTPILVKFRATSAVQAAVLRYTPESVGGATEWSASKLEDVYTGIPSVDAVLRDHRLRGRRALFPLASQRLARSRHTQAVRSRRVQGSMSASALEDFLTLTEFTVPAGANVEAVLQRLERDPNVVYAERRPIYRASHMNDLRPVQPDDPRFSELWGQHNIGQTGGLVDADVDAPEAWDIQKGSRNVVVAVLDSGIDYTHPDLQANIWTNPGEIPDNGLDDDQNGFVDDIHGYDFFHGDSDPMDDNMHGTHVSGTIGAAGNNGRGVVGLAWEVSLMAVKFLGPAGSGTTSVEAIYYAANSGAPISNNSWGGSDSEAVLDAVNFAAATGQLFLAAAGNAGVEDPHYPAFYDAAVAVASTNDQDRASGFSNRGTWVEIAAPGSSILSTIPSGGYGFLSGTSMATPQVSGLAALLLAEHPDWSKEQLATQLIQTADNLDAQNPDLTGKLGSGRINAHQALLPATPRVELRDIRVDDDQFGASIGNLDALPGAGETLELHVRVQNVGAQEASGVSARLTSSSTLVTVAEPIAQYPDLPFLASAAEPLTPFVVRLDAALGVGTAVPFELEISDGAGGSWQAAFSLETSQVASLEGTVVDLATGQGIPHATVRFSGPRSDFTVTEEDGAFRVTDLPTGTYVLTTTRTGYAPTAAQQLSVAGPVVGLQIGMGIPEADVSPAEFLLSGDWGSGATGALTVANTGSDNLTVDLIEVPDGAQLPVPPIRVGVLRSAGTQDAVQTWRALGNEWADLGPVPVTVDYTSLNTTPVTSALLEAANFDVLYVAHAVRSDKAFSDAELDAIAAYVEAGHGLIVTGSLDSEAVPGSTRFLAGFMGLENSLTYTTRSGPASFSLSGHGLGRRLPTLYASASQTHTGPVDVTWSDAAYAGRVVGASDDGTVAVVESGNRVYMAHLPEQSTRQQDRQLVYNAILHAGLDQAWLLLDTAQAVIAPGQSTVVSLSTSTQGSNPGDEHAGRILMATNSPDQPQRLVSVSAALTDGSRPTVTAISVEGGGIAAAGEEVRLSLGFHNSGTEAYAGGIVRVSTSSPWVVLSETEVGMGEVPAKGDASFSGPLASLSADAPDGVVARLQLSFPDRPALDHAGRLVIRRLSAVSGRIVDASTGLGVSDEPIRWEGATQGSTLSSSDGTYALQLPDGDYLIRAGGNRFAESGRRPVTVPPGVADLDFSLQRPEVSFSATELAATVLPWETDAVTLEVANSGLGALRIHTDFVPSGVTTQLEGLISSPPPAVAIPGPEVTWDLGRVLVFKEESPLGNPLIEPLLEAHGAAYDVLPGSAMGTVDLSPYRKVIIPSNQPTDIRQGLSDHRERLEAFAAAGGILQMHLAFNNNFDILPGGIQKEQDFQGTDPIITDTGHPLFAEPNAITPQDLSFFQLPGDGSFTLLPANADTLVVWSGSGKAMLAEIPFGNGAIVASTQMVEDGSPYLENLLLYRLARPRWVATASPGSAVLQPQTEAVFQLSVAPAAEQTGTSLQALYRVRSNAAGARSVEVPVQLAIPAAPGFELASTELTDGQDNLADAGETVSLAIALTNTGGTDATNVTATLTALDAGITAPASPVSYGTVPAGATVQGPPVAITLDASIPDNSMVRVGVLVTADGGVEQALETSLLVYNDTEAPGQVTDLALVATHGTGAHVSFTGSGGDGVIGTPEAYAFRYSEQEIASDADFEAAAPLSSDAVPVPGGQGVTAEVYGLPGPGDWHIALRALDRSGNQSPVSNSLLVTTAPAITATVTSDTSVAAGSIQQFYLELQSVQGEAIEGATIQLGPPESPAIYLDEFVFVAYPNFVGTVGSDPVEAWLQVAFASDAAVGTSVPIPIIVRDGTGRVRERLAFDVLISGPDEAGPAVSDSRFLAGIYGLGQEVIMTGNVYEPGPVTRAEAVVLEGGLEIARVSLEPVPDGGAARYGGTWTVDRVGEFEVAYEAEDASGNVLRTSGGAYQAFSSHPFQPAEVNLLVVDAVTQASEDAGLAASRAMDAAGLSHDTWRTAVQGRALPASSLGSYTAGLLVYAAPEGSFSGLGGFLPEETRATLASHLTGGGAVLLAAQGLTEIIASQSPSFLAQYFGAKAAGYAVGSWEAVGSVDDPIGDGLALNLSDPPANQYSPTIIEATGDGATSFLAWGDGSGSAGVRFDEGRFRSVLLTFGLDGVPSGLSANVIGRSRDWAAGNPTDDTPPAAVTTLRAEPADGSIRLSWVATGDDGRLGRAMGQDLRYATVPPGPDWAAWWQNATRVSLPGRPLSAGFVEEIRVDGLDMTANYFFALRVEDDGRNWSPLSNLARHAPGHPTGTESADIPEELALHQAYPNPFSGRATVRFDLPEGRHVRLAVFDLLGRRVASLVDQSMPAGYHQIALGTDRMPSGVYFVRLETEGATIVRQVVRVR